MSIVELRTKGLYDAGSPCEKIWKYSIIAFMSHGVADWLTKAVGAAEITIEVFDAHLLVVLVGEHLILLALEETVDLKVHEWVTDLVEVLTD